jgi:signal recognition particle receptor subunit alpha
MADSLFSLASVFNDKGLVLWERFHTVSGSSEEQARDAINELIQNVLLQERSVESNKYVSERGHQDVRFVKDNQCGSTLVFALVIASSLASVGKVSSMMERLIEAFRTSFVSEFRSQLSKGCDYNSDFKLFDDVWPRLQDDLQQTRSDKVPRAFEKKDKSKDADDKPKQSAGGSEGLSDLSAAAASVDVAANAAGDDLSEEEKMARARAKLALKAKGSAGSPKAVPSKAPGTPPQKKKSWKDQAGMGAPSSSQLDYSEGGAPAEEKPDDSKFTFNLAIDESSDEEDVTAGYRNAASAAHQHGGKAREAAAVDAPSKGKGWWQSFMTMTGNVAVDAGDIAPAMQQFRDMLIQKNVAADIAENITTAVCDSLVGKKISGLHGIKAAAKDAMEEALTKILTPKQSIDILSEILLEKQRGNPYIICFVGVNGVGKSTTLAKVLMQRCYYLMR